MTPREKVLSIFSRRNPDGPGYWTGNPHEDTYRIYLERIGGPARRTFSSFSVTIVAGSPPIPGTSIRKGAPIFDPYRGAPRQSLNQPGPASRSANLSPRWRATLGLIPDSWISPTSSPRSMLILAWRCSPACGRPSFTTSRTSSAWTTTSSRCTHIPTLLRP